MTDERAAVLRAVAARIAALARPALVAVDGVTAAGKTTFADELAVLVMPPVVRVSVDDFHRPEAERRAHGEGPESYYHDTFDLPTVRTALSQVDVSAVAIVDGVFLLRPELAGIWSLTIFLAARRVRKTHGAGLARRFGPRSDASTGHGWWQPRDGGAEAVSGGGISA